ncbi:hypothetical protein [Maritalea mobilis]|uniref:hypothetical protein n=1 Tax=Maritalea mobilis TaxID=483324 RepID=UPI0035A9A5B3
MLAERLEAMGLSVLGMPIGSPVMEMGNQRDVFYTLFVMGHGSTEVFRRQT